jgi:hypothetical protein
MYPRFPLRAHVGSSSLFDVSDSGLGFLYNMYMYRSLNIELVSPFDLVQPADHWLTLPLPLSFVLPRRLRAQ